MPTSPDPQPGRLASLLSGGNIMAGIRSKSWAAPVSEVLSVTASIAELAGAAGLPFAGLAGIALRLGSGALKPDIKQFISEECGQLGAGLETVQQELGVLRETVSSGFEIIADCRYKEGLLSIEAAFDTFLNLGSSGGKVDQLAEKMEEFRSHKFELEKEARHHLAVAKLSEYLTLLATTRGPLACLDMFDYVVAVQTKYLTMFCLYHLYRGNTEGLVSQFRQYNSHYTELERRLGKIVSEETVIPFYRHGKLTYRDVTPLCVAAIQGEVEVVVRLVVRGGADTEHRASRVNRHRGRPPLTGLSPVFLAAESGQPGVLEALVTSAAQFGRVTAVAALARLGADRTELERATNVARQYGHAETVEWIEQFCSKADAAGDTTLPYQDS